MDEVWLTIVAAAAAVVLACVHLFGGRLRFIDVIPRSRWLSAAGGAAVAYVFLHILPDLESARQAVSKVITVRYLERHVYILALLGLAVFYGLERLVKRSRGRNLETENRDMPSRGVFWIHISSFGAYNVLVGYLLMRQQTWKALLLFAAAMALHFFTNDYGLRQDHKEAYRSPGRYILAGAVVAGWLIGSQVTIHEAVFAALFAFLAGGVVLNVLKEELPKERQSRFWAFAVGAILYAALILLVP